MAQPLPIIIDTDPGQDDAVAILLALASPELEVLAVTAVAGNVPLALTEVNARKICELAGGRTFRFMPAPSGRWCAASSRRNTCTARRGSTDRFSPHLRCRCKASTLSTIWSRR